MNEKQQKIFLKITTILLYILIGIAVIKYYYYYSNYNSNYYYYFKNENIENFEINPEIPKVIYLSYKNKNIPDYIINNWKKLYPDYEVKLYDNNDCIEFLKNNFGNEGDKYVDIFNYIKDGPIKADFWRVCVLYKNGGIYSDIDVEPLVNVNEIIDKDTSFFTSTSFNKDSLNPHFIVSPKEHIVLKKCIDKYLEMYKNKIEYSYWGWSIVTIMKEVFFEIFKKYLNTDGVYFADNKKYQMLKEVLPEGKTENVYCEYQGKRILNNRYNEYDPDKHQFK